MTSEGGAERSGGPNPRWFLTEGLLEQMLLQFAAEEIFFALRREGPASRQKGEMRCAAARDNRAAPNKTSYHVWCAYIATEAPVRKSTPVRHGRWADNGFR